METVTRNYSQTVCRRENCRRTKLFMKNTVVWNVPTCNVIRSSRRLRINLLPAPSYLTPSEDGGSRFLRKLVNITKLQASHPGRHIQSLFEDPQISQKYLFSRKVNGGYCMSKKFNGYIQYMQKATVQIMSHIGLILSYEMGLVSVRCPYEVRPQPRCVQGPLQDSGHPVRSCTSHPEYLWKVPPPFRLGKLPALRRHDAADKANIPVNLGFQLHRCTGKAIPLLA